MADILIREALKTEPRFFEIVGPWLGCRRVDKEVGYRLYNDPCTRWIVAFDDDRAVGFLTWTGRQLGFLFVEAEYRRLGIASRLVDAWLDAATGHLGASCNSSSRPILAARGFVTVRQSKNFTTMEVYHG